MPVCRYWNCVDTVTTYYIYSNGRVIAEYDDDGDLVWNYVYGLGQRVARYNGNNKHIYHNDHLGNMRAITDTLGAAALAAADYYPFGEMLSVTGAPGRFTYNGNELDNEYGFDLYYYGARYMDPSSGRFITPDPNRDFYNPYSYVHNNPMNRIDPTGMWSPPTQKYRSCTGYEFRAWHMGIYGLSRWQQEKVFQMQTAKSKDQQLWEDAMLGKYAEEYKQIRNFLMELKGEVKTLYDKTGDDRWNKISGQIDILLKADNIYGLIKLEGKLVYESREGKKEEVLGQYDFAKNLILLSLKILNEGYSGAYIKMTLIHEISHRADDYPGRNSAGSEIQRRTTEYFANEYAMRYWDSLGLISEYGVWPFSEYNWRILHQYHWLNDPGDKWGFWAKVLRWNN